MSVALTCRDVTYRCNDAFELIVDELRVPTGSVFAIEGPNGAGKSTLLWLLCGLIEPNSGSVTLFDQALAPKTVEARRRSTLVMENPYLLKASVRRNVEYGLARRGLSRKERRGRVLEALRMVGLERLIDRSAWQLSQGERKRVALARALALRTDILLLDEPTSFVDRKTAILIEDLIEQLRGATTIILSTHDVEQSRRLADEVVTLIGGRLSRSSHENVLDALAVIRNGQRIARLAPGWEVPIEPGPEGVVTLLLDHTLIRLLPDPGPGHKLTVNAMNVERHAVRICLEGSPRLIVRLTRENARDLSLELGTRVRVEVPPEAVRLLSE